MFLEILTLVAAALAGASGLFTIHRNRKFFFDFSAKDFFNGRIDAWLYLANSWTTAASIVGLVLRFFWVCDSAAMRFGAGWISVWLVWHLFISVGILAFHLATNYILRDDEFCSLCKQPLKKREAAENG